MIYFLIGLPGSGKTTYGNRIVLENKDFVFLDDISQTGGMALLKPEYTNLIISDVAFCNESTLQKAICAVVDIYKQTPVLIYFENNIEKCFKNIKKRNDGRKVENTIAYYSKIYNPPTNCIEIYDES